MTSDLLTTFHIMTTLCSYFRSNFNTKWQVNQNAFFDNKQNLWCYKLWFIMRLNRAVNAFIL